MDSKVKTILNVVVVIILIIWIIRAVFPSLGNVKI
ncbi:MAG: hypothetical protein V4538_15335 [Bacteroidota bacterium]